MGELNLDQIIENITLNIFTVGTKKINFYIIKSLPTDVETIMKNTGLTKVPVNNHFNELEKCGLLVREKGTGKADFTDLTKLFKKLIVDIESEVKVNIDKMIPKVMQFSNLDSNTK